MTALPPIIPLDDLRVQLGFKDGDNGDDLWLVGAVESVAEAIESPLVAGRWFRTRGAVTLLFDAESVSRHGRYIDLSMGLQALTYLGVAWGDQPDDGTGTYTEIVSGVYLDPPAHARQPGEPASRISLGHSSASLLPTGAWKRCVKVTGTWGWASAPLRVQQIARAAVIRAFRARKAGGADYAVPVGPDGGMKILRDFAPSEIDELRSAYRVPTVA